MKESYLFEKDPGETEITWTDPKTKEKKKATGGYFDQWDSKGNRKKKRK